MSNKVDISQGLKRKLKHGKEYHNLIPRVSCEPTKLGNGDTYFTVNQMQDWIVKYSQQTEALAKKLLGNGVKETVDNIYNFLYNHIQYTADGEMQRLLSPACAWKKRHEGLDCKSYSVFASSILWNLGIPHIIRQIKQPNFSPNDFTHVYIVVPQKSSSNGLVIDATKHQNVESIYTEKADLIMNNLRHVGLNAPQDDRAAKLAANFDQFCKHLIENGIPVATVNAIRKKVSDSTSSGGDPQFKIVDAGVLVSGELFPLVFSADKEYQAALGFAVTGAAAVTAGKTLMNMLPADFIGDTFGAVFANGFDLTCWNASYNETKAQEHASMDLPYIMKEYSGLAENTSTENYNKFLNAMYGYIDDAKNGQSSRFASCTQKGYALREQLTRDALAKVTSVLEGSGIKIIQTGDKNGYIKTMEMPSQTPSHYEWGEQMGKPYTYPSARLEGQSVVTKVQSFVQNTGSDAVQQYSQPTNTQNYQTQNAPVATAPKTETLKSDNTMLMGGGVLAAALLISVMVMKKKDKKK